MRAVLWVLAVAAMACGRLGVEPVEVPASEHRYTVAAGNQFSCAVRADATVWCWGDNASGQMGAMGDATGAPHATPVQIAGLTDIAAIAAGIAHACALDAAGAVWCWGDNGLGQVLAGGPEVMPAPHRVDLPVVATQISAGDNFTCARTVDERAWCWGLNSHGQIEGPNGDLAPTASSLDGVMRVAAGDLHTCALRRDGTVWCWGYDLNGRLGRAGDPDAPLPIPGVIAVDLAAASWTCAVLRTGRFTCWGRNSFGMLGDGMTGTQREEPTLPSSLSNLSAIATGGDHTCALLGDGTVACWGSNAEGQIGDGPLAPAPTPQRVPIDGVVAITARGDHSCAARADGSVWCWGRGTSGQLGDGTIGAFTPHRIDLGAPVTAVSAGGRHTCAIADQLYCWGENRDGELGDGTRSPSATPRAIPLAADAISAGETHTCGTVGGVGYCWGSNTNGELGDDSSVDRLTPVRVQSLSGITAIAAGTFASCACDASVVSCWGRGVDGDLGNNAMGHREVPDAVMGPFGAPAWIAHGGHTGCLIDTSDATYCWGNNGEGKIGDGTITPRFVAVRVMLGPAVRVATRAGHTCASLRDNTLACWGRGRSGQLGDGTLNASRTPVTVLGLPAGQPVTDVAVGTSTSYAIVSGTVYAFGDNGHGQLGDGTSRFANAARPIDLPVAMTSVSAGDAHACSVGGGALYCWGDNAHGEQGTGGFSRATAPVRVALP